MKQRFPDTNEMLEAAKYSSIEHVRERVYSLLDKLETVGALSDKLSICMCLEPYGIHMAGTEHGPTELKYAEFINSIRTYIADPENADDV